MNGRLKALAGALVVLLVVAASVTYGVRKNDKWTPDGFLYARMMLVDTGMSEADARTAASRFYLTTPAARDPHERTFYAAQAPAFFEAQYPLFRGRPLYPWLAARLYPWFGFLALKVVAAIGAVIAAAAAYRLFLLFGPWWLAACGAIAAVSPAAIGEAAVLPLTDGLALGWWTVTLAAIAAYARRPSRTALIVAIVAAALLALTRPAIWLPIGAAAGFFVAARFAGDPAWRRGALVMLLAQLAVAAAAVAYTAAIHGANLVTLTQWAYTWQTAEHGWFVERGLAGWYLLLIVRDIVSEPARLVLLGLPVLAIAAAAIGFALRKRDPSVAVLLGAACAAPLAILLNPIDIARTLELPLASVVTAGVVAALGVALRPAREAELVQQR
jgi:hypothetical protein